MHGWGLIVSFALLIGVDLSCDTGIHSAVGVGSSMSPGGSQASLEAQTNPQLVNVCAQSTRPAIAPSYTKGATSLDRTCRQS